jgi:hypothetical protein
MKSRSVLSSLLAPLALSTVSSLALADDASLATRTRQRVESELVGPLAQHESSRFSRGRPAPRERRVRVPQANESFDRNGRAFVRFAVDVRFGGEWHEDDIVGCAYPGTGELYVKRGDEYRPAAFLLGKNVEPAPGVCESAPHARS